MYFEGKKWSKLFEMGVLSKSRMYVCTHKRHFVKTNYLKRINNVKFHHLFMSSSNQRPR